MAVAASTEVSSTGAESRSTWVTARSTYELSLRSILQARAIHARKRVALATDENHA
jgi:hypothetical protein